MLKDRQIYGGFWSLRDITRDFHDVTTAGARTRTSIFKKKSRPFFQPCHDSLSGYINICTYFPVLEVLQRRLYSFLLPSKNSGVSRFPIKSINKYSYINIFRESLVKLNETDSKLKS